MTIMQLWLPVLLSAVGVFVASSILHMALKFWHIADYHGFTNEDEVADAIRKEKPAPGIYMLPFCSMENMNKPETREKFDRGPVGLMLVRADGMANMGITLGQWFAFCLLVSLFVAYVAVTALTVDTAGMQVFRVVGTVGFMTYAFGSIPLGIWWGQPWISVFKDVVDGLIYGLITAAMFAWLWPQAAG